LSVPGQHRGSEYVVCPEAELPPGGRKLVPVGKFGVGVFNVAGRYYAITNYCPHEGAPLCMGPLTGTTAPQAGEERGVRWVQEGEVIRCPWHRWEFDITTGRTLAKPEKRIRSYEVRVVEGEVRLVL
jgi:nitrite reductase/ring-hydroxylating ferredoxin subunit